MENKERPLDQQLFNQAELILRYYRGELSASESEKLAQWLAEDTANQQFAESLQDAVFLQDQLDFFSAVDAEAAWQKVAEKIDIPLKKKVDFWQNAAYLKYAAVFVVLCLTGLLAYKYRQTATKNSQQITLTTTKAAPVTPAPVSNQAQLTLANGTVIQLNNTTTGTIWNQNNIRVQQNKAELQVFFTRNRKKPVTGNNTLTTPVGGQYQITLPDGSQVWLNASSALTFSESFGTTNRTVTLTGEGYFEVAKNKAKPFLVKAPGTAVEVLGTYFNVMAYPEEPSTTTTLLEGSVKISNPTSNQIISPGYQARTGKIIAVEKVDVAAAVAWKNGLFHFQNTELAVILRQLERWYGVEFVSTGRPQNQHFTGLISRQTEIAKVLKMLELSGDIKFKTTGKKVIIQANTR